MKLTREPFNTLAGYFVEPLLSVKLNVVFFFVIATKPTQRKPESQPLNRQVFVFFSSYLYSKERNEEKHLRSTVTENIVNLLPKALSYQNLVPPNIIAIN